MQSLFAHQPQLLFYVHVLNFWIPLPELNVRTLTWLYFCFPGRYHDVWPRIHRSDSAVHSVNVSVLKPIISDNRAILVCEVVYVVVLQSKATLFNEKVK